MRDFMDRISDQFDQIRNKYPSDKYNLIQNSTGFQANVKQFDEYYMPLTYAKQGLVNKKNDNDQIVVDVIANLSIFNMFEIAKKVMLTFASSNTKMIEKYIIVSASINNIIEFDKNDICDENLAIRMMIESMEKQHKYVLKHYDRLTFDSTKTPQYLLIDNDLDHNIKNRRFYGMIRQVCEQYNIGPEQIRQEQAEALRQ